jgi:uroporphyrinogen-III synthase
MAINNPRKMILITRPENEAESFAREVEAAGFIPLIEPLLNIVPLDYKKPESTDYEGLIFTSANAVRVFGCPSGFANMTVFCVGEHTASAVREVGYSQITSGQDDGVELAALIAGTAKVGAQLLHIRGEHTAVFLEDILLKGGITVEVLTVYTARAVERFSPQCRAALENEVLTAVTFFSKRTAENFLSLIEKEGLSGKLRGVKALCISESVLECVRGFFPQEAYSARLPDRASMIELIASFPGAHRPET